MMGLLQLAPGIQEEILFLPAATEGRDPVTERQLRPIVAEVEWGKQREHTQPPQQPADRFHRPSGMWLKISVIN